MCIRDRCNDIDRSNEAMSEMRRQSRLAAEECEQLKAEITTLNTTLDELRANFSSMQQESTMLHRDLELQLRDLQRANESLVQRLSENVGLLTEERYRNAQLSAGLKEQMEAWCRFNLSFDNNLDGIRATLAEFRTAKDHDGDQQLSALTEITENLKAMREAAPSGDGDDGRIDFESVKTTINELQTWYGLDVDVNDSPLTDTDTVCKVSLVELYHRTRKFKDFETLSRPT